MYTTDFICTYKLMDEEYQDMMFQIQFLQAFGIGSYSNEEVDDGLEKIYSDLKDNEKFKKIIKEHPHYDDSEASTLMLLFSFDTFDLFHMCLIDYYKKKEISDENMEKLLAKYKDL